MKARRAENAAARDEHLHQVVNTSIDRANQQQPKPSAVVQTEISSPGIQPERQQTS
jgi:hypothetical protein